MRAYFSSGPLAGLLLCAIAQLPAIATAQTEALPAIAKETYRPRPEVTTPLVPAVRAPVVTDRVVVQPRVVTAPSVTVVEKPVVAGVVAATPVASWWAAFARNRYGYYDDAFSDDDWFYDYYELPRATPVVVERPAGTILGYRTTWTYEPAAERALFSW
jgi:hypothetical protein